MSQRNSVLFCALLITMMSFASHAESKREAKVHLQTFDVVSIYMDNLEALQNETSDDLLDNILQLIDELNVTISTQCLLDTMAFVNGLSNLEMWTIQSKYVMNWSYICPI